MKYAMLVCLALAAPAAAIDLPMCAKTLSGQSFGYCDGAEHYWLIGNQSESALGQSCAGPNGESLPVETFGGGPLSFAWGANFANLKTDFANYSHPCGLGRWTWFSMQNNVAAGGLPLERPGRLRFRVDVDYTEWLIASSSTLYVEAYGSWDGRPRGLAVALHYTGGDAFPLDPLLIQRHDIPAGLEFVVIDGAALGIAVSPYGGWTALDVDFGLLFRLAVARGYLEAVSSWDAAYSTAVGISTEMLNDGEPAGVLNLRVRVHRTTSIDRH